MRQSTRLLLAILPSLVLMAGLALTTAPGVNGSAVEPGLHAALAVAAIGPLVAAFSLQFLVPGFDVVLVATAGMLSAIGMRTLFFLAATPGTDRGFYIAIATRHGYFVGAGFAALIVGAVLARRIEHIAKYPFTLVGLAVILTATTVVFGQSINGARLWLQAGPVRFQPSEIARLLLAAFIAVYLYERRHLVAAPWRVRSVDLPPAPYLVPLVGAVLAAVVVLVLQNDLGMAALVILGAFASVASVMSSRSSFGAAAVLLGIAAAVSYATVPRVRDRVAGWLDPWHDPAGRGFQFVQADYRLAAGGLTGLETVAPAASVPEIHTDLILVGVASQLGWLGAVALLALVGVLVCRCVLAALSGSHGFQGLLALSLAALLAIQVILIAGGTLRVLPLTGLTFPLVSYGGTSMVATMFALGLVVGIGASQWGRRERGSDAKPG